jgi:hypothetical protein
MKIAGRKGSVCAPIRNGHEPGWRVGSAMRGPSGRYGFDLRIAITDEVRP